MSLTNAHPGEAPSPRYRRGVVGIASIIAMVFMQLLIVGSILTSTRDQDSSIQRVNAARAFYAAEGGMNMVVREVLANGGAGADLDGDGIIGGLSDDSNDADNPRLGNVQLCVTRTTVSNQSQIATSNAIAGLCRSRLAAKLAVDQASSRRVIYGQWANQSPQYRIWDGTQWGAARDTLDLGAKQYWSALRRCPTRTEVVAINSLQGASLMAAVQGGMTWGNLITLTTDCGTVKSRPFYIAYEQNSGHALVVYRKSSSSTVYFRTWDGNSWSAESSYSSPLSGKAQFMKLVPRRGSNQLMLLISDDNDDAAAAIWDGSAFGNAVTLDTGCPNMGNNTAIECTDAAWETASGHCMVVWSHTGNNQPQYRVWDGSVWQTQGAMPAVAGVPIWPHLASDRASNKLMYGVLDDGSHVTVNIWSGSAWGSNLQVEAAAPAVASRCFDVAFEPAGTKGMVMYGHSVLSQPRYRLYSGSSWGSEQQAPALPGVSLLVQLTPSRNGSEIMILHNAAGGQNSLEFMRWDGTTVGNLQELESNLSGPAGAEVFMIPDDPQGIVDPMRVWTWAPSAP